MNKSDIEQISWFHAIELEPGLVTPGRFKENIPPNYTLFPVFQFLEQIDLHGQDCLDIGTWDGIMAFIMRMRGGNVVATDLREQKSFALVRGHLGLHDVKYLPEANLDNGDLENKLSFEGLQTKYDLVLLCGVIYHSYAPLTLMSYARRLLKMDGLLVVESVYHQGADSVLYMNWDAPQPMPEPQTYFLPTLKGLHSLLSFCCCDPIATLTNSGRVGVLAKAKSPQTIANRSKVLEMIFSKPWPYAPLDFSELDRQTQIKSNIRYTGKQGEWSINNRSFTTTLPLQPKWQQPPKKGSSLGYCRKLIRSFL